VSGSAAQLFHTKYLKDISEQVSTDLCLREKLNEQIKANTQFINQTDCIFDLRLIISKNNY
jgi:hypothetical protein